MRNWLRAGALALAITFGTVSVGLTLPACAARTSHLQTPEGRSAFYQVEALTRIERLQQAVIDANANGGMTDAVAIPIVRFTVGSAKTIRALPNGWLPTVSAAWTEVRRAIPAEVVKQYAIYLMAIDAILATVSGTEAL